MDERQLLLEAKELITQQKYEAARRLLRPIAQHPTAEKWLATLDKIAPPPPPERIWDDDPTEEDVLGDPFVATAEPVPSLAESPTPLNYDQMTPDEKFLRVKLLLKIKNYPEARAILQTLPDDPAAQKLIEKLDQMPQPASQSSEFSAFNKTAFSPPAYPKSRPAASPIIRPKPANMPYGKPIHPGVLIGAILTFAPAAMVVLCLNWRRLGKRHWVWPSAALGVVILLMLIPAALIMPHDSVYWRAVPVTLVIAGFHVYLFGMYYMQHQAYQHYSKYSDVEGMLNHHYDWGRALFITAGLAVVAVAVGLTLSKNNAAPPITLDTPYLALERPNSWHSEPAAEAAYCHDYAQGCFLYLRHNDDTDVGMAFAYFPLNGAAPDALANALWGQYIVWYPNLPFGPRATLTVDHIPVVFQEYTFPHRYSASSGLVFDYYVSRGYVPTVSGLVEITFWSADQTRFHDRYKDYEAIINSIDLKNPT